MKAFLGALKNYKAWLLILAPTLLIIVSLNAREIRSFYWLGQNFDPEYAYLLNFLNIINLKTPGHIDHPGTPLQILGGIILWVYSLFNQQSISTNTDINLLVLQNPETYLKVVNFTLLLLIALCQGLLGLSAFFLWNSITLGLILQFSPFLLTALAASNRVSPEPLLLCVVQILCILLLFYIYKPETKYSSKFSLCLGCILGLGMAIKINFFPLLLLLLLLPSFRQWGLALFAIIGTFILGTLPILSRYGEIFEWILRITTHTGRYGTGNKGFIDIGTLPDILSQLISLDPIYFVIVVLSLINFIFVSCLFFVRGRMGHPLNHANHLTRVRDIYQLFSCLIAISLIQVSITLKHPGIHYLVPSMGFSGILILLQVLLYFRLLEGKYIKKQIQNSIALFMTTIFCVLILNNINIYVRETTSLYTSYKKEVEEIDRLIKENYQDCVLANYYRASSKAYALKFGDSYAQNGFSSILKKIYPDEIHYNLWTGGFDLFGQDIEVSNLQSRKCVLLRGTPLTALKEYAPKFKTEEIFIGNSEALYKGLFN